MPDVRTLAIAHKDQCEISNKARSNSISGYNDWILAPKAITTMQIQTSWVFCPTR